MTRAERAWLLQQARVYAVFWLYAVPAAVVYVAAAAAWRSVRR